MNSYDIKKGDIWEVEYNDSTKTVVVLACFDRYAATVTLQEQPGSAAIMIRARDIMYADTARLGWIYYDKMANFVRELSAEEDEDLRSAIVDALELEYNSQEARGALEEESTTLQEARREVAKTRDEVLAAHQKQNELLIELAEVNDVLEEARKEADRLREELAKANYTIYNQVEELEALKQQLKQGCGHVETVSLLEERTLREELAAAQREAEIYKGLYEQLLARALG